MDIKEVRKIVKEANRSEIHRVTGLSLSGVSRILSGNREPKTRNLKKVADALGVHMDDLYAYLIRVYRAKRRTNLAA